MASNGRVSDHGPYVPWFEPQVTSQGCRKLFLIVRSLGLLFQLEIASRIEYGQPVLR